LTAYSPSRPELRRWLLGRELFHEHLDLFNSILAEYRLSVAAITGSGEHTKRTRQRMVDFAVRVPRLRIAAEMKVELFRNASRSWTWNMVHDIDFLSESVPYCRIVVADRDATDLLKRTGADKRHGTLVTSTLQDLPDRLTDLRSEARTLPGDPTGWDVLGPGNGFETEIPARLSADVHRDAAPDWAVRMTGPDGSPTRGAWYTDEP
jgi:hypothetical protein